MKAPTRLFDLPGYQFATKPLDNALAAKEGEEWKTYSSQWLVDTVEKLAASFCENGIGYSEWTPEGRDKIAIISENRPEWIVVDQASQISGAVLVPIYPTVHNEEIAHIFNETKVKWVFTSNKDLLAKVEAVRSEIPSLEEIFSFEEIEGIRNWKELLKEPGEEALKKINAIREKTRPEDLATIIYTSGTSGAPKGVMLSHHNIISNVMAGYEILPTRENGRALSFLPLNHVYERMLMSLYLYSGVPIYFIGDLETIGQSIKEVHPYIFATVPRLLEKVYERIMETGSQLKGVKRKLFYWAVGVGDRYKLRGQSLFYKMELALAKKLVLNKWREALGGKLEVVVTGSAACQLRLLRLFTASGVNILEGYGLTETSPVVCVNRYDKKDRMFGTVGPTIDKVEVKIAEDGEILCKGPNIMQGYYKNPEKTAEVMEGEWFKTGDIGEIIEGRFLKITDRKKELFKTSGGKYIAPLPIETKMVESHYIAQIMAVGDNKKFCSALIVPDFKNVKEYLAGKVDGNLSNEELIEKPEVKKLFQSEVDKYNKNFGHIEQVKAFRLLPKEWSIEGGELTPTLKLKRKVILEKYEDVVEDIYNGKKK